MSTQKQVLIDGVEYTVTEIDGIEYTVTDEGDGEVSLTYHKAGITSNLNFVPVAWLTQNGKPIPVMSLTQESEDFSEVPNLKGFGPLLKGDEVILSL